MLLSNKFYKKKNLQFMKEIESHVVQTFLADSVYIHKILNAVGKILISQKTFQCMLL